MGAQQVLRTASAVAIVVVAAATAVAAPPAPTRLHEKVAVIDLGPADHGHVRQRLATAVVAAGLDPVIGDGIEDALAGQSTDSDGVLLAAAMEQAEKAFGALACADATISATRAIAIGSSRQAAGLPAPLLPRAWAYVLLCADRAGDIDAATIAAQRLATLGGAPDLVDAAVLARYPVSDVPASGVVEIQLDAGVAGAEIWVDHVRAGASPVKVVVGVGDHVVAAASGSKRAAMPITVGPKGGSLALVLIDQATKWSAVAARVASWKGQMPSADELSWVLGKIHARIALIRHGDIIEAWGQIGRAETPHRLGGDDGVRNVIDVDRVMALIVDRAHTWNDHAPDPDRPLLTESAEDRANRDPRKVPTKWWVYAAIIGAVATAVTIVYIHDSGSDTQHLELHYP